MRARWCPPVEIGLFALLVWLGAGTGCDTSPEPGIPDVVDPADPRVDIADALAATAGVVEVEDQGSSAGYRRFAIAFEQPVDHASPEGPRFLQRLTLMHRDRAAPLVLATTGYHDFIGGRLTEPAAMLEASQLVIEHRYFGDSRPEPVDWSFLDIEQAAADHHRVVEALAPIYTGAWISTGISKGGSTSIFHRRFYPDDVVGTIAYVAPMNLDVDDARYEAFFDTIDAPDCRQRVRDLQREALVRRDALEARFADLAAQRGYTFARLDGMPRAFEAAVVELEWTFWQYFGVRSCDLVPATTAADDELVAFLELTESLWAMADQQLAAFEPYYYQVLTQLGYPSLPDAHLADLLQFDYEADLARLLPAGVMATYDPEPMRDIAAWVAGEGERLLLVYGAHDPWTAGAFELGEARDSYLLVAPSTNHGATFADLPGEVHEQVMDVLRAWSQTGQPAAIAPPRAAPATFQAHREALRDQFPARPRLGM